MLLLWSRASLQSPPRCPCPPHTPCLQGNFTLVCFHLLWETSRRCAFWQGGHAREGSICEVPMFSSWYTWTVTEATIAPNNAPSRPCGAHSAYGEKKDPQVAPRLSKSPKAHFWGSCLLGMSCVCSMALAYAFSPESVMLEAVT